MIEAIIILVLILMVMAFYSQGKETAVACRNTSCGVECTDRCHHSGTYNSYEVDEIKRATINSAAHMDYSHSYWNGVRRLSCDECPNSFVCPECPRHCKAGPGFFDDPNKIHGINDKITIGSDTGYSNEYFLPGDTPSDGSELPPHTAKLPLHDMDSEFIGSREQMGAHTSIKCAHPATLTSMKGEDIGGDFNDSKFDQDNAITMQIRKKCKPNDSSAVKLLYTNVMGLADPLPDKNQCEYLRYNGYVYKEPCELGEQY